MTDKFDKYILSTILTLVKQKMQWCREKARGAFRDINRSEHPATALHFFLAHPSPLRTIIRPMIPPSNPNSL
jgi:hypothetical protein